MVIVYITPYYSKMKGETEVLHLFTLQNQFSANFGYVSALTHSPENFSYIHDLI